MWQIKKLPFYIDLVFCLVLLPAMITLLPIERWLVSDSLFVYLLVSWLYIVYILNRRLTMPFLFAGNRRFLIALILILFTLAGTYFITRYHYCPLKIANSSLKLLNYSLLQEIFLCNDLKS